MRLGTAAVAVPLVASIVAPTAAEAQSCIIADVNTVVGFTSDGQCCAGICQGSAPNTVCCVTTGNYGEENRNCCSASCVNFACGLM